MKKQLIQLSRSCPHLCGRTMGRATAEDQLLGHGPRNNEAVCLAENSPPHSYPQDPWWRVERSNNSWMILNKNSTMLKDEGKPSVWMLWTKEHGRITGMVWHGVGVGWRGVAWRGVIWYDMVWCGLGCEGISNCVLGVLTTLTSIWVLCLCSM